MNGVGQSGAFEFPVRDLYVSFRNRDGSWSRAMNLGPGINSPAGEVRPYLPPGGGVLFFSDRSTGSPEDSTSSLERFQGHLSGPGNGSQDIHWVDAAIPDALRAKARP